MKTYQIAVIKGDGIGPEVCEATMEVLRRALPDPGCLDFTEYPAGAEHYRKTGVAFPDETFEGCRRPGGSPPHRLLRRRRRLLFCSCTLASGTVTIAFPHHRPDGLQPRTGLLLVVYPP